MRCVKCKSHRIMKFIDGFGQSRCFCRSCGRSFLEFAHVLPTGQKSLLGADAGLYYRPGIVLMR
jgi:hypothetical protein